MDSEQQYFEQFVGDSLTPFEQAARAVLEYAALLSNINSIEVAEDLQTMEDTAG